jgi:hypothetical protein
MTDPSWQPLVDVPLSREAPALIRHAVQTVLPQTGLQEAQFRFIHGLMDVVALSLDGAMAVHLEKRRRH